MWSGMLSCQWPRSEASTALSPFCPFAYSNDNMASWLGMQFCISLQPPLSMCRVLGTTSKRPASFVTSFVSVLPLRACPSLPQPSAPRPTAQSTLPKLHGEREKERKTKCSSYTHTHTNVHCALVIRKRATTKLPEQGCSRENHNVVLFWLELVFS